MLNKYIFTFVLAGIFSANLYAQKEQTAAANTTNTETAPAAIALNLGPITPYKRATPAIKQNNVGVYPKLKSAKSWDGVEPGKYSLKFVIKGIKHGDTVYLADYHLDGKYRRDTAIVDKNGLANFTGTRKLQHGFYLFVFPQVRDYFEFIVDDDQDFTISTDTSYWSREYFPKMKVNGSEQNSSYLAYQLYKAKIIQQIIDNDKVSETDTLPAQKQILMAKKMELLKLKNNYDSFYIATHPNHLLSRFLYAMSDVEVPMDVQKSTDSNAAYKYYKEHYWDHIDFNEDGLVRVPLNILKQKFDFFFDKVIPPDADMCIKVADLLLAKSENSVEVEKYIIWYLTNRFETSNIMGMDKAFVITAQKTYCSGKAWWIDSATVRHMCDNARDREPSNIGKPGVPLELADKDGIWHNTGEIKAPYTILIFWDPTCGHCREVMPKLAKIYNDNKAKGWKVVALSPSDKKKEWLEYQKEHPEMSEFLHLLRGEVRSEAWAENLRKYYVIASPTIYILNENKVIEANRIDVDKIEDFLNHLTKLKGKKTN